MQLAENVAIRTPSGALVPLLARGAALPIEKRETLSTAQDDQESIRCELVVSERAAAFLEVGVGAAPRGVARARLVIHVDDDGAARASLEAEEGSANASFSVRVTRV